VIGHYADRAPVVRYAADEALVGMDSQIEAMALYAGQSAAPVHDILSADLVRGLVNQSREALTKALSRLQGGSAKASADR
jgi:hypothetical protein